MIEIGAYENTVTIAASANSVTVEAVDIYTYDLFLYPGQVTEDHKEV